MRSLFTTICALVPLAFVSPSFAQNAINPGGPWVTPNQNISLEAFRSYEQLTAAITKIADDSGGLVAIESIALTAGGRDVWLAKIGDASKPGVLVINQQHGDEPHGAEASIGIIKFLASDDPEAQAILDELFVLIVPRMNPDGATYPDRGNGDLTAPVRNSRDCFDDDGNLDPGVFDRGRGVFTDRFVNDGTLWHYDMNRYHWPDWSQSWQILCNPGLAGTSVHFDPIESPVPEAAGVIDAYNVYQPIWVIDVHNQGPSVIDEEEKSEDDAYRLNRLVTGSILWPTNAEVEPAALELSQQMALIMKKRSIELGYAEITRFNGGDFPGIARNAYGLLGSERILNGELDPVGGSVLLEILGQTEGSLNFNLGQKSIGKLRNVAGELVLAVIEATADGSVFLEDVGEVDNLILMNDPNIGNPRADEEGEDEDAEEGF